MVYSLDEYLKMNAEIIELNQESNKIFEEWNKN